jgi:hypothetical protein
MRNPSFSNDVRKRLLRAGFDRSYAERAARELQDHWDDLIDEGIRSGLSEREAITEAANRFGSADDLAREISTRMQHSSWLGRNPTFAFGMLAITLTILWWVTLGSAAAEYCGLLAPDEKNPAKIPIKIELLAAAFDWIRSLSYVALPWICCYIATRFRTGWRPALWACLVLAIHNGLHSLNLNANGAHGNFTWSYSYNTGAGPALLPILAPLAVFAIHRAWHLRDRTQNEFPGQKAC